MMISTVRGEFTGITGSVTYDPKDPARDAVEAAIRKVGARLGKGLPCS
jgi:polyisoprenoid-binding protein YceI